MTAELNIQAALRGDITYLKSAYCTQPFKIADVTENKKGRRTMPDVEKRISGYFRWR